MPNDVLTAAEAIAYLGLDRQGLKTPRESLRWLCRMGRLKYSKVGKHIVFRQQWLDEMLDRAAVQKRSVKPYVPRKKPQ